MNKKAGFVIGLLITMGVVFAGAGSVSAQTATDADFDDSGDVGFGDFVLFAAKFGLSQGDANYDARFDLDDSGDVGFADFVAFARLFGETVPLPPLALTGIAPAEGMPGTLIELVGQFDADTAYQVKFGTVLLPVDAQDAERMTAMVPVLESGSVQVRVVEASGRESEPTSFRVLALPAPRMNAEQLRQTVADVGKGIGNAFVPLTGAGEVFNAADAALFNREMGKLNATWGVIGERIAALPPEEAALLSNLLDNSGALGILEGLGKIDLSASKVAADADVLLHHLFYQLDLISFALGNVTAVLDVVTVVSAVAAVTGVGTLVSGLSAVTSITLSLTQVAINSFIPTDLKELEVEIAQTPVPERGRSDVAFFGVFKTENDAGVGGVASVTLNAAISKLLEKYIKSEEMADEAAHAIENYVRGVYSQVFGDAVGSLVKIELSDLDSELRVRLDMGIYRKGLLDTIFDVVPVIGTAIGSLLEKLGIDPTYHEPVTVQDTDVATYQPRTDQLEGIKAGKTLLTVRAYRFEEYAITVVIPFTDHTVTLASIWKPAGVATQAPFEVTRSFNFQGIAHDDRDGDFYTLHAAEGRGGGVWGAHKKPDGSWEYNELFNLSTVGHLTGSQREQDRRVSLPLGITFGSTGQSNRQLYVVGMETVGEGEAAKYVAALFNYMSTRDNPSDKWGEWQQRAVYTLPGENVAPFGVAFVNGHFHVVDAEALRVYAYTASGSGLNLQRDRTFNLVSDNGFPGGITYADGRFYVVDLEDERIYAYARSGDSWAHDALSDFKLDNDNSHPSGITVANGLLHVVNSGDGKIHEYGPNPVVESLAADDSTLTTGRTLTLRAVIRNRGIAAGPSGTLRVYRRTHTRMAGTEWWNPGRAMEIATNDFNGLKPGEARAQTIDLGAPKEGRYDYYACVTDDEGADRNCSKEVGVSVVFGGAPAPEGVAVYRLDPDNGLPAGVTSAEGEFYVVDADSTVYAYDSSWNRASSSDFKLTAANGFPEGIAAAAGRFYVVDRGSPRVANNKVFVYAGSGTSASQGFSLRTGAPPRGVVYADGRFRVVHSDRRALVSAFAYDSGGFRNLSDEFPLEEDNDAPAGIAYADGLFFVVDSEFEKVYAYDGSGMHKPTLDFALHSSNADPSGIAYANNRFYVVDARDSLVYRYPKPEKPDLTVESLVASADTLAPGEAFTLIATVKNVGNAASDATTLRGSAGGGEFVVESIRRLTNRSYGEIDPAWSPDGRHIAFAYEPADGSISSNRHKLYVMESDGSNPRILTNDPAGSIQPAWSPDGRRIAFASNRDGNWDIYVMESDGSNPRNLTNYVAGREEYPAWSPDGRHIAFASNRDDNNDIYVMESDGSNPRNLTNNANATGDSRSYIPAWSPDGRHIAFESWRDGNYDIYVMESDGSNPRNLTNDRSAGYRDPAWSPDGRHIAFVSYSDAYGFDISVMGSDGSNPRNLTNTNSWTEIEVSPTWSPDGRHIAFDKRSNGSASAIYVITFQRGGQ